MMYTLVIFLVNIYVGYGQGVVMTANFINPAADTGVRCYINYLGLVMNLTEVQPYLNSTLFQGYLLNSGINANWNNVLAGVLRMPKGWFYQCSNGGYLVSDTTHCIKQLKGNTTFFNQLGTFASNCFQSPYWVFGINNEMINFSSTTTGSSLNSFYYDLLYANNFFDFIIEMMFQGDKAIQNGMRSGSSYTSTMFIQESFYYQEILFGITYKAPGLTESATSDWMVAMDQFFYNVWYGVFTFQSVIFTDPTLATIQNLLSDNYTKGYLQRRAKVNSSFTYQNFNQNFVSLSRVRLVYGQGIDGITNTFAAALWWVDFVLQSCLYRFYDISIQGASRAGNYQSVFGPPPNFTPTALYYGAIMATLAIDSQPYIIIPSYTTGTSTKIKVYGLELVNRMRYVILNKDTNSSLNGNVHIIPKTGEARVGCIYLEAPSLASKAENMKIAGHQYIGGNFTPQGTYKKTYILFNSSINGFAIPIKYAQVALCQTQQSSSTEANAIPTKNRNKNESKLFGNILMLVLLMIFLMVK